MSKMKEQKELIVDNIRMGIRDGTEVQKGGTLTEDYLEKNFDEIGKMLYIFVAYPDVLVNSTL